MTEPPLPSATVLPPAARLLWRSPRSAQVELGTRRIVLDGVGSDVVRHLLGSLPVTVGPDDTATATALQEHLLSDGLLWSAPTPQPAGDPDPRRSVAHPRLSGELTALSARAGERAAELLDARRHATVAVHGSGRCGPHVAAVLAAAGVGRVHVLDTGPVRLHHAVPGGVAPHDEGTTLAVAASAAVQRQAPEAVSAPPRIGDPPDLVVLASDEPVDAERRDALHARSCAHLLVRISGGHGAVGPLVIPGLTSCLRCADLHRLDRDPAWDALAAQLAVPHRATTPSEVSLATVVAGLAAVQALDFLDGGHPATVEGTLEMQLPDWRLRRRTWPIHPDCDCMPGRIVAPP